jgi:hypothetical protein
VTRRLVVAAALVLSVLTLAPSAAHAQYQTSCGFIIDPPAIPVGGVVNIVGSQFTPGSVVTFYIEDPATGAREVLGSTTADNDPDGNIQASFPLPAGFDKDGEYVIVAQCPDGQLASNVLIVGAGSNAGTTTATASTLPVTGSNPWLLARIALTLVALGGLLLLVVRRRARSSPART